MVLHLGSEVRYVGNRVVAVHEYTLITCITGLHVDLPRSYLFAHGIISLFYASLPDEVGLAEYEVLTLSLMFLLNS